LKQNKALTALLLCTVGYYLATLAVGHSEIRYGLPMQIIFVVFAAVAVEAIATWSYRLWQLRHQA
jgi:membrane protein YdbS with pleckstrin-like domain